MEEDSNSAKRKHFIDEPNSKARVNDENCEGTS
jgi:hypothetical protein